nr:helix-turn-helix domain-containing protein [uncultured Microbacterium sp.]
MNQIIVAPHGDPTASLREIVDELATLLDRTVLIADAQRAPIARSGAGAAVARAGDVVSADEDEGALVELETPVIGRAGVLGYLLVLADPLRPLPRGHLDAVDAAVSLLRGALESGMLPTLPSREETFGELLSDDLMKRRAAFALALDQRWLLRGDETVIHAVRVESAVSRVLLTALGRRLSTSRHLPFSSLGVSRSTLYLVSSPPVADLETGIAAEAADHGIRVLGIGSASPSHEAHDLGQAALDASSAADLSSTFEEFQPGVNAAELGGWLLLASSAAEPSRLKLISPAAHALYFEGGKSQRQTIEAYLDVSGNVVAACEILFVHRTTLYYRLEKMPQVVRDALADGMKRSTLHLALKLIRMWESTGRL